MSEHVVSLANISQGAAVEMFDQELKKLVENVADANTKPKQKREITLKVTVIPDEDRKQAAVDIAVTSKLAGHRGSQTSVFFGRKSGVRVAVETDLSPGLFDQGGSKLAMVPVGAKEGDQK